MSRFMGYDRVMRTSWIVGVVCVFVVGCGDDGGARDSGPRDAGMLDAGMAELPPQVSEALGAVVQGLAAATGLTAPLVPSGERLRDMPLATPADRDMAAQTSVEDGVAGNSIVTEPMCVAFSWAGLTVTATFTSCVMEATGEVLDGSISLTVSFTPTTYTLAFTALTIGDLGLDGELNLRLGGGCIGADAVCAACRDVDTTCMMMRAPQRTVFGDITVSLGTEFALSLEELRLDTDAAGTTVNGTGAVTSTAASGSFTATDLHIAMGQCLPTSGTLLFTPATGLPATIGFLPTTPTDGIVNVTMPPFPTVPMMLFMPCGT